MPIAWLVCRYVQDDVKGARGRMPAIINFSAELAAEGAKVVYSEVLGSYAIAKVNASVALLQLIDADADHIVIALNKQLDSTLSDLSQAQKDRIRNVVLAMGYTVEEITATLGNDIGAITLRQLLQFCAQRRFKPRWDETSQSIILDGPQQQCRQPESLDVVVV